MMANTGCPHCGQVHRQAARFCPVTGKPIAASPPQAAPPAPQSAPPLASTPEPSLAGLTGRLPSNTFLNKRYLIVRKVGQGGMAAVYQTTDTMRPGVLCAVKEMSDAALANAQDRDYAIQAFQQEANLLRRLNHPNLPKVTDAFTENGKHYLVMEYVQGDTLQNLIEARTQPYSEAEVRSWALQLCDVLEYLHCQNPKIIFRDLKPSNIMLTPQGQIKLIDFGIVRFFKPGKDKDTVALGTPGYAAPEAAGGQTDERSDLYSLCVTLHQLLTLHDPATAIFRLPPARSLNLSLSIEVDRLLERGTQNQREMRWQSAAAMRMEMERLGWRAPRMPAPPPGFEVVAPGLASPMAAGSEAGRPPGFLKTVAAPPPGVSSTGGAPPASMQTSRPTTRLLMLATQLSPRQLAMIAGATILILMIAAWALAPALADISFDWNKIPITALFGALAYAAFPRRGSAFAGHVIFSLVLISTVWIRLDLLDTTEYSWGGLLLGLLVSGIFMEIWVSLLPRVKGDRGKEAWLRESGWMAVMAAVGSALLLGVITGWETGLQLVQWAASAVLGVVGWFLGDFLQQYLLYRRSGAPRYY